MCNKHTSLAEKMENEEKHFIGSATADHENYKFVILCFPIFALKLECLLRMEKM